MPFDAAFLTGLCKEIRPRLVGAKIDKINMPEKDMLIFTMRGNGETFNFLISLRAGSARIQITNRSFEKSAQPPMFCMLLRKYIPSGYVVSLEQLFGERICLLKINAIDDFGIESKKTIVVELLGKALNLILLDDKDVIIDCLRHIDYQHGFGRALLPGFTYVLPAFPDKPNFYETSKDDLRQLIVNGDQTTEPVDWLLQAFGGLSPFACREISAFGWEQLPNRALDFHSKATESLYEPTLILENDCAKDYYFLRPEGFKEGYKLIQKSSFCTLLDDFYGDRDLRENLRRKGCALHQTVKSSISRTERKLAARREELAQTENREENKKFGDLITANIYRLTRGLQSFEAEDYYQEGCPKIVIPLDPLKNPQQNAAYYYKKYTKAARAEKMLTQLISENEEALAYLRSVEDELNRAKTLQDLEEIRMELVRSGYIKEKKNVKAKQMPARKPLVFHTPSGKEVLVGRGNTQNDELTFKTARRTDLWFHVQKAAGSHVILSQADGPAESEDIQFAANLAVEHSSVANGGKTAVDYTEVRFVKKPVGALPGRVIYTNYQTIIAQKCLQ